MTRTDYDPTTAPAVGVAPWSMGVHELDFTEYMHWMYLPVFIDESPAELDPFTEPFDLRIPPNLAFATDLVNMAYGHELVLGNRWRYVYLTARRGFATPGNPLNRPGWHLDGFGTPDVNYVWTDRFPTDFVVGDVSRVQDPITDDHELSMLQFEAIARVAARNLSTPGLPRIVHYDDGELLRLDSTVLHAAPEIPAPGGERSFLKISFSDDRYDLVGNAHNHLFDYDWPMHPRAAVRNDPASAGKDSSRIAS